MRSGRRFGASATLRGLRMARLIQSRPRRRNRQASGVTRWTARSILSAKVEAVSDMNLFDEAKSGPLPVQCGGPPPALHCRRLHDIFASPAKSLQSLLWLSLIETPRKITE